MIGAQRLPPPLRAVIGALQQSSKVVSMEARDLLRERPRAFELALRVRHPSMDPAADLAKSCGSNPNTVQGRRAA